MPTIPTAAILAEAGRCPRCGSTLVTDGRRVWCTYIGGMVSLPGGRSYRQAPCTYGIDSPVSLTAPAAPEIRS
jgi:hypothetical protein